MQITRLDQSSDSWTKVCISDNRFGLRTKSDPFFQVTQCRAVSAYMHRNWRVLSQQCWYLLRMMNTFVSFHLLSPLMSSWCLLCFDSCMHNCTVWSIAHLHINSVCPVIFCSVFKDYNDNNLLAKTSAAKMNVV